MNRTKAILPLLAATLLFSACQKDLDYFIPDNNGMDTVWQNTLTADMPVMALKRELAPAKQVDSFDVNTGVSLQLAGGYMVSLPANALSYTNGLPVTGKAVIETMIVPTKGSLLRAGLTTYNNGAVLINSGTFFSAIKKGTEALALIPTARMNVRLPAQVNQEAKLFFGEDNLPFSFNWMLNGDTANKLTIISSDYYAIASRRTGWLGCHYFDDTTGITQTRLSVALPSNFTNSNSMAYVVFNDQRSVAELRSSTASRQFVSGDISVNKNITVVVMSKQVNDYYLGTAQVTTAASGLQQIAVTPVKRSMNEINAFLDSL